MEVPGATLRALVRNLNERYPGIAESLVNPDDADRLMPGLGAIVDGEPANLGLLTPLDEQSEVHFIPAIAGGAIAGGAPVPERERGGGNEMRLASRMSRLGTETAFEALARAKALEAQGHSIVFLGIGEPDYDTPAHIVEAAKGALDAGIHALRAVARHHRGARGDRSGRRAAARLRVARVPRGRHARRQANHVLHDPRRSRRRATRSSTRTPASPSTSR